MLLASPPLLYIYKVIESALESTGTHEKNIYKLIEVALKYRGNAILCLRLGVFFCGRGQFYWGTAMVSSKKYFS